MKKVFSVLLFVFAAIYVQAQVEINGCDIISVYGDRTIYFEIYGNVYVITNPKEHADIEVRVVDSPQKATYNIYKTTDTPRKCGEWRFVNNRNQANLPSVMSKNMKIVAFFLLATVVKLGSNLIFFQAKLSF